MESKLSTKRQLEILKKAGVSPEEAELVVQVPKYDRMKKVGFGEINKDLPSRTKAVESVRQSLGKEEVVSEKKPLFYGTHKRK